MSMMTAMKSARDGLPRNTSEIGTETETSSREDRRQAEWGICTGGLRKKGGFFYFVLFLLLLLLFEKTLGQNELKRVM